MQKSKEVEPIMNKKEINQLKPAKNLNRIQIKRQKTVTEAGAAV